MDDTYYTSFYDYLHDIVPPGVLAYFPAPRNPKWNTLAEEIARIRPQLYSTQVDYTDKKVEQLQRYIIKLFHLGGAGLLAASVLVAYLLRTKPKVYTEIKPVYSSNIKRKKL